MAGTQLIKKYTGIENKWFPLINVGLGITLGVAWSLSFYPSNLINFILDGAIAGLFAGCSYDLGANLKKGKDRE